MNAQRLDAMFVLLVGLVLFIKPPVDWLRRMYPLGAPPSKGGVRMLAGGIMIIGLVFALRGGS